MACVPGHFDWNDVGSWSAVRECVPQDDAGNAFAGDVLAIESQGCVVHSSGPVVATVGLKDTVVVATEKSVLVIPRERSQEVKKIIEQLKRDGRSDLL